MNKKAKKFEPSEKAKEIRHLRIQKGWSQRQLAEKTGVPRGTIQNVETGKHSPLDKTLGRILKGFEGMENADRKEVVKNSAQEVDMKELIGKVKVVLGESENNPYRKALIENIKAFFIAVTSEKEGVLSSRITGPEPGG